MQDRAPRRNRVTPEGELVAIAAKGTLMGNRGRLTNDFGRIVRPWRLKRWISCTLNEVFGTRVRLDDPFGYTPLFFTDEAVALAAGHRPCGMCRPDDFDRFVFAWKRLRGVSSFQRVRAADMDADLHSTRRQGNLLQSTVSPAELPKGSFAKIPRLGFRPALIWEDAMWVWNGGFYERPKPHLGADVLPLFGHELLRAGFRLPNNFSPRSLLIGL